MVLDLQFHNGLIIAGLILAVVSLVRSGWSLLATAVLLVCIALLVR